MYCMFESRQQVARPASSNASCVAMIIKIMGFGMSLCQFLFKNYGVDYQIKVFFIQISV